ncbi:translation initiation factor eIF4E, partial [Podila epigama]
MTVPFVKETSSAASTAISSSSSETLTTASPAPSTPTKDAAPMSARRQSRGPGEGPMLRPNFVFPPVKEGQATTTSSITPANNDDTKPVAVSTQESLAPPAVLEPKSSQHLKTHYRTHSRNGSTVTVQDLKQAIASVASSLLDPPPPEAADSVAVSESQTAAPSATQPAAEVSSAAPAPASAPAAVDPATPTKVSDPELTKLFCATVPAKPAYQPYRPPGSRLRAAQEAEAEAKAEKETPTGENLTTDTALEADSDSGSAALRARKPVPPPLVLSTESSEKKTSASAGLAVNTSKDLVRPVPQTPSRILTSHATPRLISSRSAQSLGDNGEGMFSPRNGPAGGSHTPDYFSMRPLQHPPRTPMTPGGDFGDDDDDYYGRLDMVTTPMIQNGFFPNWAKGDAQLEELERIRKFLAASQYPDEMPLSDEWTLFFSDTSRAKDKSQVQDAYSSAITPLFTCHTVPQFATSWKYVRERVRPASMKVNQNLHWFKKGIKPMWEDPRNKYGGRLTICPPRSQLDLVWETVLILMAGDVLDHHGEGTGV